MPDIAALQHLINTMFPGLMGVRLTEITADRVLAEMLIRPDLCTAGGILHGGAYMAFADTLGAIGSIINLPTRAPSSWLARAWTPSPWVSQWRCTSDRGNTQVGRARLSHPGKPERKYRAPWMEEVRTQAVRHVLQLPD
jgi:hypothetical protein